MTISRQSDMSGKTGDNNSYLINMFSCLVNVIYFEYVLCKKAWYYILATMK